MTAVAALEVDRLMERLREPRVHPLAWLEDSWERMRLKEARRKTDLARLCEWSYDSEA